MVRDGDCLIDSGEHLVSKSVDNSPTFILLDRGKSSRERAGILIDRGEQHFPRSVDERVLDEERVDKQSHDGTVLGEVAGEGVGGRDDNVAIQVCKAIFLILFHEHTAAGREFQSMIDAGYHDVSIYRDQAAECVFEPDTAVAVGECSHMEIDVRGDDSAVITPESIAVAVACGLDAIDKKDVASAGAIGLVTGVLCIQTAAGE